jgi:phospholipase/lecithinase/hemolysin
MISIHLSIAVLLVTMMAPTSVPAMDFNRIVVFGGSLSDSGNFFALTNFANRPPYNQIDATLIPTGPYSVGGNHFSNGKTWIEQLASRLSLTGNVRPAFAGPSVEATDYAVGGARARDNDEWGSSLISMTEQVDTFVEDFDNQAPSDALYVIDFGGNDVRDAIVAYTNEGLGTASAVLQDAITSIASNMHLLYGIGARKFLVLNVADIGNVPSIILAEQEFPGIDSLAKTLSEIFNENLETTLGILRQLPGIAIAEFNVYATVDTVIAEVLNNEQPFGMTNANTACIEPSVAPFRCETPDQFLFWDGIHPTKAGHAILAQKAAEVLGK